MAALWVQGVKVGGWALGLPYFLSATYYALAMLVVSRIKL